METRTEIEIQGLIDEYNSVTYSKDKIEIPSIKKNSLNGIMVKKTILFIIGLAITIPLAYSGVLLALGLPNEKWWLILLGGFFAFALVGSPIVPLLWYYIRVKQIQALRDSSKIQEAMKDPVTALALYYNLIDLKIWNSAASLLADVPAEQKDMTDTLIGTSYKRYPGDAEELKKEWRKLFDSVGKPSLDSNLSDLLSPKDNGAPKDHDSTLITQDDNRAVILRRWDTDHSDGSSEIKLQFSYPVILQRKDEYWYVCTPMPTMKESSQS